MSKRLDRVLAAATDGADTPLPADQRGMNVTVNMPVWLVAQIRVAAQTEGRSVSNYVCRILAREHEGAIRMAPQGEGEAS